MDVKDYTPEEMEDIADKLNMEFERLHGVNRFLYTPIDDIVENYFAYGIEFIPLKRHIDGYIVMSEKKIFINERLGSDAKFEGRCSFTLAHEVGHLLLHFQYVDHLEEIRFYSDKTVRTLMERQANQVAAAILMPRAKMNPYWEQKFRVPKYEETLLNGFNTDLFECVRLKYKRKIEAGEYLLDTCLLWEYFRKYAEEFRVSPQAFIRRARNLKLLIRENAYYDNCIELEDIM